MTLSDRIRSVREDVLKWTQPQLQEALGFKRTATISDWERGVSKPTRETLERIAQLAGKSYGELFGVAEQEGREEASESWRADPNGSPAERIIYYVQYMGDFRRESGTPSYSDQVAAAYGMAADQNIPVAEYRKLDAWRDQLLGG